jgi:hypothetical protein
MKMSRFLLLGTIEAVPWNCPGAQGPGTALVTVTFIKKKRFAFSTMPIKVIAASIAEEV